MAANNQAKQKAIIAALRAGNTRRAAAAAARINPDTFYRWLSSDPSFSDAVKEAEAGAQLECVKIIKGAALSGVWQAAAWLLERHPDCKQDWKRVDELDLRKLTVEQLLALESACESRAESTGDRAALRAAEDAPD